MNDNLEKHTKEYWEGIDTKGNKHSAYSTVQKMKKDNICKYDMDCYRKLLTCATKMYRK